jgi:hypothetical protein
MVLKFQVATACFSSNPPDFNLSKLSSIAVKATTIIFPNYTSTLIQKSKPRSPCLKPLLITILASSLSPYYSQKDERVKPGNLLFLCQRLNTATSSPGDYVHHYVILQKLLDSIFNKLPVFMRQWEKEKAALYPIEVPPP